MNHVVKSVPSNYRLIVLGDLNGEDECMSEAGVMCEFGEVKCV